MPSKTAVKTDETEPNEPESSNTLTAVDRCDRNKAEQAYVRLQHKDTGHFLDLCYHHSNKYEAGLIGSGFLIVEDIRHTLNGPTLVSGSAIADSPECPDDDEDDEGYF